MNENIDSINENRSNDFNNKNVLSSGQNDVAKNNIKNNVDNKPPISLTEDLNKDKVNEEYESSEVAKIKPIKAIPIEKKPFNEFVNDHLLPSLITEFKERGLEVEEINLKNTYRPIAGDKCWVIYCDIKDICNFWLSFEKDDISSLKSISLCKTNQKPSVIESFLIDEKRITLKLIISRILQRLNGQKLIGIN